MKISLLLIAILGSAAIPAYHVSIQASQTYVTPWADSDKNLYSLINDGYSIVGSSLAVLSLVGSVVEVVYVQREKKVYRCVTTESKDKAEHICTTLTDPRRAQ